MKIAFIGKGGSGKTTVTGLFSKYLSKEHKIVSIDADINQNLSEVLQIKHDRISLGDDFENIKTYFHNNRNDVKVEHMIGTTVPNQKQSNFIRNNKTDKFLQKYSTEKGNIKFLRVGTYENEDIGTNCYHSKLGSLELFFHHTKDTENDYYLADSTAGVDILGTSLYLVYDVLVFIVEPTLKSISVLTDFLKKFDRTMGQIFVIGNKIITPKDKEFIKQNISNKFPIIYLNNSTYLREFEQGETDKFESFYQDNESQIKEILNKIKEVNPKNQTEYTNNLTLVHNKSANSWYSDYFGHDISFKLNK